MTKNIQTKKYWIIQIILSLVISIIIYVIYQKNFSSSPMTEISTINHKILGKILTIDENLPSMTKQDISQEFFLKKEYEIKSGGLDNSVIIYSKDGIYLNIYFLSGFKDNEYHWSCYGLYSGRLNKNISSCREIDSKFEVSKYK